MTGQLHKEEDDSNSEVVDGEIERLSSEHFRSNVVRSAAQVG